MDIDASPCQPATEPSDKILLAALQNSKIAFRALNQLDKFRFLLRPAVPAHRKVKERDA